jgi:hypothetical protein
LHIFIGFIGVFLFSALPFFARQLMAVATLP